MSPDAIEGQQPSELYGLLTAIDRRSEQRQRGKHASLTVGERWNWEKRLGPGQNRPAENELDLRDLRGLQAGLPEP